MLKFSGLARSTFYYSLKHQETDKYDNEKQAIIDIFNTNKGRYGYRRVLSVMRQRGYTINHKTVLKLMKSLGLKGKQRKNGKYRSYKGEVGKVADNLLKRDFSASKPFEKLTTDVTEFKVCNKKVYLSPVMDLYNREIISYSIVSFGPGLAVSTCGISAASEGAQYHTKYVEKRKLYGQWRDGKLLRQIEGRDVLW